MDLESGIDYRSRCRSPAKPVHRLVFGSAGKPQRSGTAKIFAIMFTYNGAAIKWTLPPPAN